MKKTSLSLSLLILLTPFMHLSSAHAQIEESGIGKLSEAFAEAKTEQDVNLRTGAELDLIASHMSVNRKVVFDFFKERAPKMTDASNAAWSELLSRAAPRREATADDFMQAELDASNIASFISVKVTQVADNLPFNEIDLAKSTHAFDLKKKEAFNRVLKQTVQIAKSNKVATLNDAFEQALKENGFLDEYREGCKK